jgi:hypothetical protein
MRPSTLGAWLLVVSLALAAAGCSDTINVTPPSEPSVPVTVAPEPVTEAFNGTVYQTGSVYHLVNATVGPVVTTLTEIGPDPSASIGLSIGVLNSLACSALMANPSAKVGSQLTGTATGIVTLCITVYDPGTVAADTPITYSLTVKYAK